MKKGFFLKLAANNIRKNGKTYVPYLLTCIMTVAMFYILRSLSLNPGLKKMVGGGFLSYIISLGTWIVAIFAFIFLFYTNSFLMKRRKKEFGIFHILGMEKRHLSRVLGWENFYVMLISLAAGLILGIALDKVMFLLIAKVIAGEITLGFFVSAEAVGTTILLFTGIFLLIFLNSVHQIHGANSIELLRAGNVGEREPKTKWIMTILGVGCLGGGYYIAFATENPIESVLMFFVAVILVIAGTYMLFTAGSIALLKALRRKKSYYYKTRHFTSVSGMIYRMKQNAVSLANICILSTMVLVMISSTTSLMVGMEDIIQARYPADFVVYSNEAVPERSEEAIEEIHQLQKEKNLSVTGEMEYTYLAFSAIRDGDTFHVTREGSISMVNSIQNLLFVSLSDYNELTGENKILNDNEIMIYSNRERFEYPTLKLFDKKYTIVEKLDDFIGNGILSANIASSQFVVVPDMENIYELYEQQKEALTDIAGNIRVCYAFYTDAEKEEQEAFYTSLQELFTKQEYQGTVESRCDSRQSFSSLYGGFFFIGIFLGVLFIMATVLIIYYKQISEGYDDKERFGIMQKVGMNREEVRSSIHSQVLTVFFLPLIVAGIHVAAAFPMISKLLEVMNMYNTGLYITCTIVCFLVFTVMYVFIYTLTARTYYRIVSR